MVPVPARPSLAGRYSRHPWRWPFGPPSVFGRAPGAPRQSGTRCPRHRV